MGETKSLTEVFNRILLDEQSLQHAVNDKIALTF